MKIPKACVASFLLSIGFFDLARGILHDTYDCRFIDAFGFPDQPPCTDNNWLILGDWIIYFGIGCFFIAFIILWRGNREPSSFSLLNNHKMEQSGSHEFIQSIVEDKSEL